MEKQLLTGKELAKKLKVTTESLRIWRNEGLPHTQLGERMFRYDYEDVIKWRTNKMLEKKNKKQASSN